MVIIVSFPEHEQSEYSFPSTARDHEDAQETDRPKERNKPDKGIGKMTDSRKQSNAKPRKKEKGSASKDKPRPRRSKNPSTSPDPQFLDHLNLVQPLLDETQYTSSGIPRPHPIPLVMVSGGEETMALLRRATAIGVRRKYYFLSQGVRINNLIVL